jgi:hypothetical protein
MAMSAALAACAAVSATNAALANSNFFMTRFPQPVLQNDPCEPAKIESMRNFIDEMFCASAMIFSTTRCAEDT